MGEKESIKTSIWADVAGLGPTGKWFEVPDWVDTQLPPGTTDQTPYVKDFCNLEWFTVHATGVSFIWSPNLLWFIIAATNWFIFGFEDALPQAVSFHNNLDWVYRRLYINIALVMGYAAFWHVSLYVFNYGKRPFNSGRRPGYEYAKVCHNVYYSVLGAVQYGIWECMFLHMYATGKLPFVTTSSLYSDVLAVLLLVVEIVVIPIYREVHFYFAHRFLHCRPLYKYCHAVHHRNIDIEPFSGMAMHPVEHLYYFSCILPSLVLKMHPFIMLWTGVHAAISPFASHSGYEDNMQSDQYHYLHHRYFECNYGTNGLPLDYVFGTFRKQLKEPQTSPIHSRATLLTLPTLGNSIFMAFNCAVWYLVYLHITTTTTASSSTDGTVFFCSAHTLAFLVSVGPCLIGQLLLWISEKGKKPLSHPFHTDSYKTITFHTVFSTIFAIAPVYILVHTFLAEPGQSLYFVLH